MVDNPELRSVSIDSDAEPRKYGSVDILTFLICRRPLEEVPALTSDQLKQYTIKLVEAMDTLEHKGVLPYRQKQILVDRFGLKEDEPMGYRKVADKMHLKTVRVMSLEKNAIAR